MRTVKWLRDELTKFPDDAVCYAYEGEVTGLIIERDGDAIRGQGVIHCSEYGDEKRETILLPSG